MDPQRTKEADLEVPVLARHIEKFLIKSLEEVSGRQKDLQTAPEQNSIPLGGTIASFK